MSVGLRVKLFKRGEQTMSRTRHHRGQSSRHCGHDLWGRGPGSGECYSAESKKLARQTVRSQKHDEIRTELEQDGRANE